MKEKKYKDLKGFEDKNTFNVLDQFETQQLQGMKNRLIYDFSYPIIEGRSSQEMLQTSLVRPWNRNYSPTANVQNLSYGNPGGEVLLITSKPEIGNLNTANDHLWSEYVQTVNEDEETFYFNENTIGYLNHKPQDAFGIVEFADDVDYFRSGYLEFTFKTDKQNSILFSGSKEIDSDDAMFIFFLVGDNFALSGTSITSIFKGDVATSTVPIQEKLPYFLASSFDSGLVNLNIEIKDGKMCINYYDNYNRDDVNFLFVGNETVADNEWHHVVINFGRPGLIKEHGKKFNKKFVEIWVDGLLDKRFDDKVNEYQIFYPFVKWLFNSPLESVNNVTNELDVETDWDADSGADLTFKNTSTIGFNELFANQDIYEMSVRNPINISRAFKGAMHLFAHGVNIPLSQYEIKRRYRLWKKQTKKYATVCNVNAEMKMPTVSTNSKKALKLYWDDLIFTGKNGIELDNNFQVESYSVINQSITSKTEVFNLDKTIKKNVEILENVRAAFTDNVIIYGPGMIWSTNMVESYRSGLTGYKSAAQLNPKNNFMMDSVAGYNQQGNLQPEQSWFGPRIDLPMSNLKLNDGDRILLTGQIKTEDNGIWIFNGLDQLMTRSADALLDNPEKTYAVYITEGKHKDTYWKLQNSFESFIDPQKWILLDILNIDELSAIPLHTSRWKDYNGQDRFINLQDDLNINNYDLIVFMNYPESNDEIFNHFPNDPETLVMKQYKDFLNSIKNAAGNGANLYVSSPRLAQDLGIVKAFTEISQALASSDPMSAALSPFEFGEPAERYFDNHRNINYHVSTLVPGLTNKETYLLTDFINFIPKDVYDHDQYHIKYSYRQFGLQEGNEFIIPGVALRQVTENKNLPGFKENQTGTSSLLGVSPSDVLFGTVVTTFGNCYCESGQIINNPYDDYATTIILHDGQLLGTTPINGKIFVNCVEDGYTFSREEYNKARIQVVPENEINETTATRAWQYSTTRLDRKPQKLNVSGLSSYGQTTPTEGGGGPFVQGSTNSSYGVIRHETDRNNVDYQSDLYPTIEEEIYTTQEIPVLSMTYLGLLWLAE